MHKRRVWSVAATLALALAAPAARADGGILARLFGTTKPEAVRPGPSDEDARQEAITARVRVERQKADAEKAKEDLSRRLQVVDRLVEIAQQTNDPVLEKKARDLEERAFAVYEKKGIKRDAGPAGPEPEQRPAKTRGAPRREEQ
jgi:hypothetical protein